MQKRRPQRNLPVIAALSLVSITLVGCGGGSSSSNSLVATPPADSSNSGSGAGATTPPPVATTPPPDSTTSPPASVSTGTGRAQLSWQAPTTNTDGTPLTNLAGFYIRYGWSKAHMDQLIKIASVNIINCEVAGLPVGTTYYFAVSSYTTSGVESDISKIVSKII